MRCRSCQYDLRRHNRCCLRRRVCARRFSSIAARSGANLGSRIARCERPAPVVASRVGIEHRSPLSVRRPSPHGDRPEQRHRALCWARGRPAPRCRPPRRCVRRRSRTAGRPGADGRVLPTPLAAIVRRPAVPVPTPHRHGSTAPPSTPPGGFLRVLDEWMIRSGVVGDCGTAMFPGPQVGVPANRSARTAVPEVRTWEWAAVLSGTHPSVSPSQMIAGARSAGCSMAFGKICSPGFAPDSSHTRCRIGVFGIDGVSCRVGGWASSERTGNHPWFASPE